MSNSMSIIITDAGLASYGVEDIHEEEMFPREEAE